MDTTERLTHTYVCTYIVLSAVWENYASCFVFHCLGVTVSNRYFLHAETLNKRDVAPKNRALDPRSLESPNPIFKTLILSLVPFSQTVR